VLELLAERDFNQLCLEAKAGRRAQGLVVEKLFLDKCGADKGIHAPTFEEERACRRHRGGGGCILPLILTTRKCFEVQFSPFFTQSVCKSFGTALCLLVESEGCARWLRALSCFSGMQAKCKGQVALSGAIWGQSAFQTESLIVCSKLNGHSG